MTIYIRIMFTLWATLSIFGCSTELDINAEPEDIWIVWGVLNPDDSVQYIRISKGFLPEGDALVYAKENDQSAKGLTVTLTNGNQTYTAIETDSILKNPQDGTFYPYTTIYQIETQGNGVLETNRRYTLNVSKPDDADFFIQANTLIPEKVTFNSPRIIRGPNGLCLQALDLNVVYELKFSPADGAGAYELRSFLDYKDKTENKTATLGPTRLFDKSVRCIGGGLICYQFSQRELTDIFSSQMNPVEGQVFTYEAGENFRCGLTVSDLPRAFRFEVTAADSVLSNYIQANSPAFTDFNTVRPEFTNIESSDRALGIFGSISIEDIPATFDPCTEYILGLRVEPPRPSCVR